MPMMRKIFFIFICSVWSIVAMAQQSAPSFVSPLGIPLVLSANFGELRANHFHSGLDFKTQGRTGYKIYAADEGYVSRIAVSPWGYGKALYIDHPSGYTTVYAHLDAFVGEIADKVKELQYEAQSYAIDTVIAPGLLPVERGMYVALSGNSGSSGGPHLHFEIRHTASESPIDPLPFYKHLIADNLAPEPRLLALYRHDAVVPGERHPKSVASLESVGNNIYKATRSFEAWGRVSLGIKAYDRMSGTTNIYGVRQVRCWIDDILIYDSTIDSITFAETRYINSLIDYHELRSNKGSTIMRTAILPGNHLSTIYGDMTDGTFVIDEEKTYDCRYELIDGYGNKTQVRCDIKGVRNIPENKQPNGVLFDYEHDNEYATEEMNLHIPLGALYDDFYFDHWAEESIHYYSQIHHIHNRNVPVHKWCDVAIKLTCDTMPDHQYYMAHIEGKKHTPIIGRYDAGWYECRVRSLGDYVVMVDTVAPVVTPLNAEEWGKKGEVAFKISDKESGIAHYRGEIDGKFCIFEYDAKRNRLSCELSQERLEKGKSHNLILTITDHCGNTQTRKHIIKW